MSKLLKIRHKVMLPEEAKKLVLQWQAQGKKVVFTNGCFDILHEGHVTYLAQASDEGQRLVIGLNTDASVKRQGKVGNRPINTESSRAFVLSALSMVDLVVLFDEDTPISLIELLRPDILVKGADYDPEETNRFSKSYMVGALEVKKYGGKVKSIPLVQGFSTTSILNRMKD